jgi:TIR domain
MPILRKRIFISYRREDTGPAAGRVYDRLSRILSKPNVFFDVSTIGGGENFETTIVGAIARSDAALIFIGDKWLQPVQPTGKARVWEANDYVRAELRAALARPILVLPVLVGGAEMPKPEQLPEDVKAITTKNALSLRHESFDDDTEHILATLLGVSAKERPWEDKGTIWSKIVYATGGAIAASTLMLVAALIHYWVLARPLSASITGPVTTLILIATLICGIWIGLIYEARKRALR